MGSSDGCVSDASITKNSFDISLDSLVNCLPCYFNQCHPLLVFKSFAAGILELGELFVRHQQHWNIKFQTIALISSVLSDSFSLPGTFNSGEQDSLSSPHSNHHNSLWSGSFYCFSVR